MFIILKDEKTVLAADQAFLDKAGVESIYLLGELFRVGEFLMDQEKHVLRINGQEEPFELRSISTVMGEGFVYDFSHEAVTKTESSHPEILEDLSKSEATEPLETSEDEKGEDLLLTEESPAETEDVLPDHLDEGPASDDDAVILLDNLEEDVSVPASEEENLPELLDLEPETKITPEAEEPIEPEGHLSPVEASLGGAAAAGAAILLKEEVNEKIPQDDDIFDLIVPDQDTDDHAPDEEEADTLPEIPTDDRNDIQEHSEDVSAPQGETPAAQEGSQAPFADYQMNARLIGISPSDYHEFLSQFVDEASDYEDALRGQNLPLFREHTSALKDASQLLHLPKLTHKLHEMDEATSEEKIVLLDDFFAMIGHMRDDLAAQSLEAEPPAATEASLQQPSLTAEEKTENTLATQTDILATIEPLPFDFSTHVASDELGLPEPLVEEFVVDFIKQAKENIPIFQEAEQKGDLATLQKTAHLLKGAASNLRIDPLAETLEALQHNEEINKVPDLFHQFVGQLKALDNFIHTPGMERK